MRTTVPCHCIKTRGLARSKRKQNTALHLRRQRAVVLRADNPYFKIHRRYISLGQDGRELSLLLFYINNVNYITVRKQLKANL